MTELDESKTYSAEEVRALIDAETKALQKNDEEYAHMKKHVSSLVAHIDELEKATKEGGSQTAAPKPDNSKAIAELKEVASHVDKAIHGIIDRAGKMEKMMESYVFAEKDLLLDEVMKIIEACNVQDITTQRVTKILAELGDEAAIKRTQSGTGLESGPQLPADAMSQEDIDKMLQDV